MKIKHDIVNDSLNILCKNHNLTEQKLRKKLDSLSYTDTEINKAISRLNELDMLNPAPIAQYLVKKYSHKGDRWIKMQLKHKGLSAASIKEALKTIPDEFERAIKPAQEKWEKCEAKTERDRITKTALFLAGRGFLSEVCWQAANFVAKKTVEGE